MDCNLMDFKGEPNGDQTIRINNFEDFNLAKTFGLTPIFGFLKCSSIVNINFTKYQYQTNTRVHNCGPVSNNTSLQINLSDNDLI